MMALLRLGEPGGPVPLRRRPVPGSVRPPTAAVAPPAGRAATSWPGPGRPAGSRRPGGRVQRRAVLAAAGALGLGVLSLSALNLPGAAVPGGPAAKPPVNRISTEQARVHEAVLRQLTSGRGAAPLPAAVAVSTSWPPPRTTGSVLGTTGPVLFRR
jgi:hypothetical protein